MELVFLTKYNYSGASSRYRFYKYFNYFKEANFKIEVYPLINAGNSYNISGLTILYRYIYRFFILITLFKRRKNIILIVQNGELFYLVPFFIEKLILKYFKYILDFDDAHYLKYKRSNSKIIRVLYSKKIDRLISYSNYIISGSPTLTEYCKKFHTNVMEIPTSVEVKDYVPYQKIELQPSFTNPRIGWIGSKSTSAYLVQILPALKEIKRRHEYELILIGFDRKQENQLNGLNYTIYDWYEENELQNLSKIDIGIMPLDTDPWSDGKCGFKLIQYMALGKITVSTPLKANLKIDNGNGNYFAQTYEEWVQTFDLIFNKYQNPNDTITISKKNISTVKSNFSMSKNSQAYISIFKEIFNEK